MDIEKTNFSEWLAYYNYLLEDKYVQFCTLFDKGYEPKFIEFAQYVYANTSKRKNPITGKIYAILN